MATPNIARPSVEIITYDDSFRQSVLDLWVEIFRNANISFFKRDIDIAFQHNPKLFCLAIESGQLVGTCLGTTDGHRAWIYYLSVITMRRRQGIATRLLNNAERQFRGLGINQIGLHVHNRSYAAQMFYRKLGYFQEDVQCMGKRIA